MAHWKKGECPAKIKVFYVQFSFFYFIFFSRGFYERTGYVRRFIIGSDSSRIFPIHFPDAMSKESTSQEETFPAQ